MASIETKVYPVVEETCVSNIEFSERVISMGTGAYMVYKGVKELFKKPLMALSQVAIGGALLYRGITGVCEVKRLVEQDPT